MTDLFKTKKEAQAFLRKVMGPPTRTLEGKEREQILLLLSVMEPFKETNTQRSWTSYFLIGETEYHVTSWPDSDDPVVDEMLSEDEE
jgi:hypothetical protein